MRCIKKRSLVINKMWSWLNYINPIESFFVDLTYFLDSYFRVFGLEFVCLFLFFYFCLISSSISINIGWRCQFVEDVVRYNVFRIVKKVRHKWWVKCMWTYTPTPTLHQQLPTTPQLKAQLNWSQTTKDDRPAVNNQTMTNYNDNSPYRRSIMR